MSETLRPTVGPIFLLASERSGTNLLRRRLSEFQRTAYGPSPPHILKQLYYAVPFFGDLTEDRRFLRLIQTAVGLCYEHFSPWDEEISVDEVFAAHLARHGSNRTLVLLKDTLFQLIAERKGYRTYFCKDNNLFVFALAIEKEIEHAKFIYLYRDPRDYALSQLDRVEQTSSVVRIAELWRDEQLKCIRIANDPAFRCPVYSLSYEDFLHDERGHLHRICELFGLEEGGNDASLLSGEQTDIPEWQNLNRPTLADNYGKYKHHLSRRRIRTIEAITWNPMHHLGYVPEHGERPAMSLVSRVLEREFALIRDIAKGRGRRSKRTEGKQAMQKVLDEITTLYR